MKSQDSITLFLGFDEVSIRQEPKLKRVVPARTTHVSTDHHKSVGEDINHMQMKDLYVPLLDRPRDRRHLTMNQ